MCRRFSFLSLFSHSILVDAWNLLIAGCGFAGGRRCSMVAASRLRSLTVAAAVAASFVSLVVGCGFVGGCVGSCGCVR